MTSFQDQQLSTFSIRLHTFQSKLAQLKQCQFVTE